MQDTTDRKPPERFDPASMRGELVEAEHLTRYAWAAGIASGARVLDAGCGLGYGTVLLHEGGAASVTGVDNSRSAIDLAAGSVRDGIDLRLGDLTDLDLPDDSFDLVVCFEVIEHIEDGARVLDELRRVLAPDGVLLISSPNRRTYPPGNPHHVREFTPEELRVAVERRFENVQLYRQQSWAASTITDDEALEDDAMRDLGLTVRKRSAVMPGSELYTVAVASDGALPEPAPAATLTQPIVLREWLDIYDEQQRILDEQRAAHDEQRAELRQIDELHRRLREAGKQYQEITELRETTVSALRDQRDAERERDDLATQLDDALAELEQANELIARADRVREQLMSSLSWRVTAPLRRLKS